MADIDWASDLIDTSLVYKLAMPYKEFDINLSDVDEQFLTDVGNCNEIKNLSPGTFGASPFPVEGHIHGLNIRFMVPLVCQGRRDTNSKPVTVWFVVSTASSYTCFSQKSLDAIFGEGNATHEMYNMTIQDQKFRIQSYKSQKQFENANILGADAMQKLKLSIVTNWSQSSFQLVQDTSRA